MIYYHYYIAFKLQKYVKQRLLKPIQKLKIILSRDKKLLFFTSMLYYLKLIFISIIYIKYILHT